MLLPAGLKTRGAILADQPRSVHRGGAGFSLPSSAVPDSVLADARAILAAILGHQGLKIGLPRAWISHRFTVSLRSSCVPSCGALAFRGPNLVQARIDRNRMKFSPQQDEALKAVSRWLKAPDRQLFRLFGYAGTGKTTLARHFADECRRPCAVRRLYRQGGTGAAVRAVQQMPAPSTR